ncbi:MAG: hypothetical protein A2270_04920 [Elusimicrobia bacterium RIFOXYA12_FULL_51_18]|nr:MAG: hypothetical protein A2270_04920 [Elusimicrobia bacterium RIFOXYA12_FULL_51_18]OGS30989.1 MAG: hypothetical protein A2218_07645 [Elusimicrobia bacterium RIFOXYA2_FULL_53_38]
MRITLKIKGMRCLGCKAGVENAIKLLDGVVSAEADLGTAGLKTEFDERKTSVEKIKQAVAEAGFKVE